MFTVMQLFTSITEIKKIHKPPAERSDKTAQLSLLWL